MKARFNDTFDYGKKLSKWTVIIAVILSLASLVLFPVGSLNRIILMVASIICFISTVVIIYKFCRCPYCGKRIFMGVLVVTHCPACKRNLKTGKKNKAK